MIFSSNPFILFFLLAVVLGVALLGRVRRELAVLILAVAPIGLYAYWDWRFVWVILLSITVTWALPNWAEWVGYAQDPAREPPWRQNSDGLRGSHP